MTDQEPNEWDANADARLRAREAARQAMKASGVMRKDAPSAELEQARRDVERAERNLRVERIRSQAEGGQR